MKSLFLLGLLGLTFQAQAGITDFYGSWKTLNYSCADGSKSLVPDSFKERMQMTYEVNEESVKASVYLAADRNIGACSVYQESFYTANDPNDANKFALVSTKSRDTDCALMIISTGAGDVFKFSMSPDGSTALLVETVSSRLCANGSPAIFEMVRMK